MIGQMKSNKNKMEYNFSYVLPIIARRAVFLSRNSSRAGTILVPRRRSGSGCLALGACRGTAERVVWHLQEHKQDHRQAHQHVESVTIVWEAWFEKGGEFSDRSNFGKKKEMSG